MNRISIAAIVIFMGVFLLSGCGLMISDAPYHEKLREAKEAVALARENVGAVKRLQLEEKYPEDSEEAARNLMEAEMELATLETLVKFDGENSREIARYHLSALEKAEKSQSASQRILRSHYLEQITPMLEETAEEYENVKTSDQDHPLGKYKPLVSEIVNRTRRVEKEQENLTLTEIIDDINTLLEADTLLDTNIQATLRLDVFFFDPGQYEPGAQTKRLLEDLAEQILNVKDTIRKKQPEGVLTIRLKSVGYADEMDFQKESLIELLTKGSESKVPEKGIDRRQFLNQRLSEYRARATLRYLAQLLRRDDRNLNIQEEILGKGEEIPQELTPPYSASDPRRRVCKVYGYIVQ